MDYIKYGELAVKVGVNLQKGQILVIRCPAECREFAYILMETAYKEGASEVVILWEDEIASKIKTLYEKEEVLSEIPSWQVDSRMCYMNKGACFLTILAEDPDVNKGVPFGKINTRAIAYAKAFSEYYDNISSNKNSWCLISVPVKAWADKVYPGQDSEIALEKLDKAISRSVRLDMDDPVSAWKAHKEKTDRMCTELNKRQYQRLHFTSKIGTDLYMDMPSDHVWSGCGDKTPEGISFIPNMPTEEIFTAPKADGVNGIVKSCMPLVHNGTVIESPWFVFKDGSVVDYGAKTGADVIKGILDTDEGAKRLGEVAIVTAESPIAQMDTLFYNTLFDENASCHLALGFAYPASIVGGTEMTKEELNKRGINYSDEHVDFMIGTKDLVIEGFKTDEMCELKGEIIYLNGKFLI